MGDLDRGQPALRVERGTATDEELAALTVVLLALRARPAAPAPGRQPVRPAGGARWWLRGQDHHGAHSWR
ncbi:acyl-CoA carboxylase subunit epsilon [Streptomyces sp. NPDC048404]|uniref:acyl-CoA carboxylase subunit epsilon n=1 Tax=unclassified Streptomyces TaxID=2593676 RepID=UPI00343ADE9E